MWKLDGFGSMDEVMGGRMWYVTEWKYGQAAKGEPSTVKRVRWFEDEASQQEALRDHVNG